MGIDQVLDEFRAALRQTVWCRLSASKGTGISIVVTLPQGTVRVTVRICYMSTGSPLVAFRTGKAVVGSTGARRTRANSRRRSAWSYRGLSAGVWT
jgi:hypothetical protein